MFNRRFGLSIRRGRGSKPQGAWLTMVLAQKCENRQCQEVQNRIAPLRRGRVTPHDCINEKRSKSRFYGETV